MNDVRLGRPRGKASGPAATRHKPPLLRHVSDTHPTPEEPWHRLQEDQDAGVAAGAYLFEPSSMLWYSSAHTSNSDSSCRKLAFAKAMIRAVVYLGASPPPILRRYHQRHARHQRDFLRGAGDGDVGITAQRLA